jgi:hydroxyacylglutathione hydrolase
LAALNPHYSEENMPQTIKTLPSQYASIAVNCYLVQTGAGYFLIDTGWSKKREDLVKDLERAGCRPGDLSLILLTHGDFDHSGSSSYLREKYGAKIAMHRGDVENVERGDLFINKKVNPFAKTLAISLFFLLGLGRLDRFTPDLFLEDGQDLSEYGLDASVIHLPGHSRGSIGILTGEGDLFCGDLLENTKKPAVNSLGDDRVQMYASAERLKGFLIKTVYPGHGKPFPLNELWKDSEIRRDKWHQRLR